jgi:hypothetical protein
MKPVYSLLFCIALLPASAFSQLVPATVKPDVKRLLDFEKPEPVPEKVCTCKKPITTPGWGSIEKRCGDNRRREQPITFNNRKDSIPLVDFSTIKLDSTMKTPGFGSIEKHISIGPQREVLPNTDRPKDTTVMKLADFFNVKETGTYSTPGWGSIEKHVSDGRQREVLPLIQPSQTAFIVVNGVSVPTPSDVDQPKKKYHTYEELFGIDTVTIKPQGISSLHSNANCSEGDNPHLPGMVFGRLTVTSVIGQQKGIPKKEEEKVSFNKEGSNQPPSEGQRRISTFDFNEKIQLNIGGGIGEKLKLDTVSSTYSTEATFDFENTTKIEYEGFEDEILQKIEAYHPQICPVHGVVTWPEFEIDSVSDELYFDLGNVSEDILPDSRKSFSEKPLTQKVNIGDEPIGSVVLGIDTCITKPETNTDFGLGSTILNLTDRLLANKVYVGDAIETKEKSTVTVNPEFAYLLPFSPRAIKETRKDTFSRANVIKPAKSDSASTLQLNTITTATGFIIIAPDSTAPVDSITTALPFVKIPPTCEGFGRMGDVPSAQAIDPKEELEEFLKSVTLSDCLINEPTRKEKRQVRKAKKRAKHSHNLNASPE